MINVNKMSDIRDRQNGKWNLSKNIIVPVTPLEKEAQKLREEKEAQQLADQLQEVHNAKQKEIVEKLEGLEIVPNERRLILLPYAKNPYRQIQTESGLYIENNGLFVNPDTGELDQEKELIPCAKVIEVGPGTLYVKVGDDVYYDSRPALPMPFMSTGYFTIHETQVYAIINNDLKKRLNME